MNATGVPTSASANEGAKDMLAKIRMGAIGLLGLLAAALVVLNWKLLLSRATIHLLVGRIEAPLGLIVVLVALVLISVQILMLRAQKLLASREHGKELERIRAAASDQVRSRSDTVQRAVQEEVVAIRARLDRIDRTIEESGHQARRSEPSLPSRSSS